MAKPVDAADSKSVARKGVLVRVRPGAPSVCVSAAGAAAMIKTERVVRRLRDAGLSAAQAYAFARLLADVRTPDFDRDIAHQDLVAAGYTPTHADVLIDGAVQAASPQEAPA